MNIFFDEFNNVHGNRTSTRAKVTYDTCEKETIIGKGGDDSSTDSNSNPKSSVLIRMQFVAKAF